MIDLNGLKNASAELFKRTGIFIEVRDSNSSVIYRSNEKQNMTSEGKFATTVPRSNKNLVIYAIANDGSIPSETVMQLISAYVEPFLSNTDYCSVFRDFIYGKITSDIFEQLLSSCGIQKNITYRLYLIRCTSRQTDDVLYITEGISDAAKGDILFALNSENVILIKECASEMSADEANELADALQQSISFEAQGTGVTIAASQVFESLSQVKKAYSSASDTMRLGSICSAGKKVYIAEKLRIEVFLDMLPKNTLREFLAMHSGQTISEAWDDKMIETVQALFENNLNLSVTARELYTHRNTLVYRLDKIKKISGLDLKMFDDAVMFKILMTADKLINKT